MQQFIHFTKLVILLLQVKNKIRSIFSSPESSVVSSSVCLPPSTAALIHGRRLWAAWFLSVSAALLRPVLNSSSSLHCSSWCWSVRDSTSLRESLHADLQLSILPEPPSRKRTPSSPVVPPFGIKAINKRASSRVWAASLDAPHRSSRLWQKHTQTSDKCNQFPLNWSAICCFLSYCTPVLLKKRLHVWFRNEAASSSLWACREQNSGT